MIERVTTIRPEEQAAYEAIGQSFFAEGKLPGTFNFPHMLAAWNAAEAQGSSRLWRSIVDGTITGLLGALQFPDLLTGQVHVTECFWYVLPQHRIGSQGLRLFMELLHWVKELKADALVMVRITGLNDEQLDRFYTEQGFRNVETHYIRNFKW
jgi:hypothetical protein